MPILESFYYLAPRSISPKISLNDLPALGAAPPAPLTVRAGGNDDCSGSNALLCATSNALAAFFSATCFKNSSCCWI